MTKSIEQIIKNIKEDPAPTGNPGTKSGENNVNINIGKTPAPTGNKGTFSKTTPLTNKVK